MPEKVVFSWSGGKDSAMALQALLGDNRYEVVGLLTSVAEEYKRISHHGVREELLDAQAESIGLPLDKLYLPSDGGVPCTNEYYEKLMREALQPYCDAGVMAARAILMTKHWERGPRQPAETANRLVIREKMLKTMPEVISTADISSWVEWKANWPAIEKKAKEEAKENDWVFYRNIIVTVFSSVVVCWVLFGRLRRSSSLNVPVLQQCSDSI